MAIGVHLNYIYSVICTMPQYLEISSYQESYTKFIKSSALSL